MLSFVIHYHGNKYMVKDVNPDEYSAVDLVIDVITHASAQGVTPPKNPRISYETPNEGETKYLESDLAVMRMFKDYEGNKFIHLDVVEFNGKDPLVMVAYKLMQSKSLLPNIEESVMRSCTQVAKETIQKEDETSTETSTDNDEEPIICNKRPKSERNSEPNPRGRTKCLGWKKKHNARPQKVKVLIPETLRRAVGENAQQFITETSYMVKQICPLDVWKWANIPRETTKKLLTKIKDKFDFSNEPYIDKVLLRQCKRLYRSWRYHLRRSTFEKYKTVAARQANRPPEVDPNAWEWLVTVFWESSKFRSISDTNKTNQSKQKMLAKVGTKSIARSYYEMQNVPTCEDISSEDHNLPEYLRLWKIQKKTSSGKWTDEEAEKKYEELLKLHEVEITKFGVDKLTPHEAYTRVLKHRSGYQRGMGDGVVPYFSRHKEGPSEAEIEARIDVEVNRRVATIKERMREQMATEMHAMFQTLKEEYGFVKSQETQVFTTENQQFRPLVGRNMNSHSSE